MSIVRCGRKRFFRLSSSNSMRVAQAEHADPGRQPDGEADGDADPPAERHRRERREDHAERRAEREAGQERKARTPATDHERHDLNHDEAGCDGPQQAQSNQGICCV